MITWSNIEAQQLSLFKKIVKIEKGVINDTVLVKFIIPDFELHIKELTHSAKSKKAKSLLYILRNP